ncbi:hypothetical protein GYMLUDRAFT_84372 [Collybiopsis luxurians FD-317 M1]|uniref:Uncharacterized protein n=1 Tax=Collybiopsis luxurians FD-317 M1 TaxID=944289 RepID=A0A0D0BF57_9AGAR|nr:hypothetical protein GYMLUDRAFT_84372 [Collybiopsis luxurians FD-317 M1]
MAGANFTGGRRNKAVARVKDSVGRAQKQHFCAQKLKLKLAGRRVEEERSAPKYSISDIQLAHARQNSTNANDQSVVGYIPAPIRVSPCTPESRLRLSKFSESASSSATGRSSKVLQALDTLEPLSLRAAMDQVLSIPNLAGLSKRPRPSMRRQRSSSSPCAREETRKRRRTAEIETGSPLMRPSSVNAKFGDNTDLDLIGQRTYSDFGSSLADSQFTPARGRGGENQEYSSDTSQQESWTVYPRANVKSNVTLSSSHRSWQSSDPPHPNVKDASSHHEDDPNYRSSLALENSGGHNLGSVTADSPQTNIFDYEDPWTAIGVLLGIEKPPNTPLKKRDIRKVLAEIQTPLPTPKADAQQEAPLKLPTSIRAKNANWDAESDPFKIFSPNNRHQSVLPGLLHSLIPYNSSEVSSRPPSTHSQANRLSPRISDSTRRSFSDHGLKDTDDLVGNRPTLQSYRIDTSLSTPRSSRARFISLDQGPCYDEGEVAPINSDSHYPPYQATTQSSSPLFGNRTSSDDGEAHDQRGEEASDSNTACDGHVRYRSSLPFRLSQENQDFQTDDGDGAITEIFHDDAFTPMKFALPSSGELGPTSGHFDGVYEDFAGPRHWNDSPQAPEKRPPRSTGFRYHYMSTYGEDIVTPTARFVTPQQSTATATPPAYHAHHPADSSPPIIQSTIENMLICISDSASDDDSSGQKTQRTQRYSSPAMRALNSSSQPQFQKEPLAPTSLFSPLGSGSTASLDPRAKLSTKLDMSLHGRSLRSRYGRPVSRVSTPTTSKFLTSLTAASANATQARTPARRIQPSPFRSNLGFNALQTMQTTQASPQVQLSRLSPVLRSLPSESSGSRREMVSRKLESDTRCISSVQEGRQVLDSQSDLRKVEQMLTMPVPSLSINVTKEHADKELDALETSDPNKIDGPTERYIVDRADTSRFGHRPEIRTAIPTKTNTRAMTLLKLFDDDDIASDSD